MSHNGIIILVISSKKETVRCSIGDKTSEMSGKSKNLLTWAASSECLPDGVPICSCTEEDLSIFIDATCTGQEVYSCTDTDGNIIDFTLKKCKKASKQNCMTV